MSGHHYSIEVAEGKRIRRRREIKEKRDKNAGGKGGGREGGREEGER